VLPLLLCARLECLERLGDEDGIWVWKRINALFNWLPLAALIEGKILCMHGGIGRCINRIEQIAELERPITMEVREKIGTAAGTVSVTAAHHRQCQTQLGHSTEMPSHLGAVEVKCSAAHGTCDQLVDGGAVVDNRVTAWHAAVLPTTSMFPVPQDGGPVLMDLLWSDPTTNDGVQGVQPSPRGPGLVTFGPDRVKDFCKVSQGQHTAAAGCFSCGLFFLSSTWRGQAAAACEFFRHQLGASGQFLLDACGCRCVRLLCRPTTCR
jgi:diadenosine tetraphosphatase ApaH/serine/threonine PP2A family protein phosphatase